MQAFLEKYENYHGECEFHMIGTLQPNKVKYIIDKVTMIHSVDSYVLIKEIEKQDFILTPGRYVGIEEAPDDGEPFEEKMTRLTSELSDMFAKSHELEEEIWKKLMRYLIY